MTSHYKTFKNKWAYFSVGKELTKKINFFKNINKIVVLDLDDWSFSRVSSLIRILGPRFQARVLGFKSQVPPVEFRLSGPEFHLWDGSRVLGLTFWISRKRLAVRIYVLKFHLLSLTNKPLEITLVLLNSIFHALSEILAFL